MIKEIWMKWQNENSNFFDENYRRLLPLRNKLFELNSKNGGKKSESN